MNERPILFSTEMVQAILDGRKTETRRVINKKGFEWIHDDKFVHVEDPKEGVTEIWWDVIRGGPTDVDQDYDYMKCPYGKEGDLLYVRETWKPIYEDDDAEWGIKYRADDAEVHVGRIWPIEEDQKQIEFSERCAEIYHNNDGKMPWKPSIHMPKGASRIWLRVKEIKVERVQDITVDAVFKEGVQIPVSEDGNALISVTDKYQIATYMGDTVSEWTPEEFNIAHFAKLWDGINADRGYAWDKNPWVWVVKFEVVSTDGRPG